MPDTARPDTASRTDLLPATITLLLRDWAGGDRQAERQLLASLYGDLRRLAAYRLRGERGAHTLQPTALVHEAYLRLAKQGAVHWRNRQHFLAIATRMMRRVLLDGARRRLADKRLVPAPCDRPHTAEREPGRRVDLLALERALERLGRIDQGAARLVELRFFAGMTVNESSRALGISRATATRRWELARAWLFRELSGRPEHR